MAILENRGHQPRRRRWTIALVLLVGLCAAAFALMWRPAIDAQTRLPAFDAAVVARGATVATLGNCAACHTVDPARPLAGGLPLATPFGTIHSTNLTPDLRTGIGGYTEAAFTRALRDGVARDGHLLYPAFPYDHYTRMRGDDVHALYGYLMTRTPLDAPAVKNDLHFPFNLRPLVAFWNVLYLKHDAWQADPRQSAAWNRGAYVADTLAHCSACHSPRTKLGGEERKRFLDGGEAEGWYAPALNAHSPSPLPWSQPQLAAYLRTGIAPGHAMAGGPMQDVVRSMAQADPADVEALATWIHSYLAQAPARVTPAQHPGPMPLPAANASAQLQMGRAVYAGACARCHDQGRAETSGAALQLQQAVALYDPDPRSLLHIVRDGIEPPDGEPARWMPAFAGILDDQQTVALAAYLRQYGANEKPWEHLDDSVRKAKQ